MLGNGLRIVGSVEQARSLCYQDALCSSFLFWPLLGYWQQQLPVYQAVFLQSNTPGAAPVRSSSLRLPIGSGVQLHSINRFEAYPCSDSSLNVAFYTAQYTSSIDTYCRSQVQLAQVRNPNLIYIANAICQTPEVSVFHWRHVGHLARLSPNAACSLLPALYEPSSYCQQSRCPLSLPLRNSIEVQPCGGPAQGKCVENRLANGAINSAKPYVCQCNVYNSATSSGFLSLNGKPAFLGNACQFPTADFCVRPGTGTLCTDRPNACQPRLVFDGNFFADEFQALVNRVDYIPQCNCAGTPQTGQVSFLLCCSSL